MDITSANSNIATSNMVNKQSYTKAQKMEKAAEDFESFFIFSMLENMQPKMNTESDFYGGATEEAFRPLLNQYMADEITKAGGIGLKESVINQINKYQEASRYGK